MSFKVPKYSSSFEEYVRNRHEVIELLHASPPEGDQLTSFRKRELANALMRGSVLLLSAHLEKYVESLVVEAIDAINGVAPPASQVPERLRMVQIEETTIGGLSTKDKKRTMSKIKESVSNFPWIWNDRDQCGKMSGEMLIGENRFSNPSPSKIKALFENFGIDDVVAIASRFYDRPDRNLIEIKVSELIQKRNDLAHTAATPSLTRQDVVDYLIHARRLVRGVDIAVGNEVNAIIGTWPWR